MKLSAVGKLKGHTSQHCRKCTSLAVGIHSESSHARKGERKVHLTAQILRFGIKLRQKKKLLHKLCRVRRRYRLVIAAHNISEHLEAYRRSRYYKNVRSVQRDRFFQYLSYASHIISPFYPSHTLMCSSSLLSSGSSATVRLAVTVYRSPSADASSGTFISQ